MDLNSGVLTLACRANTEIGDIDVTVGDVGLINNKQIFTRCLQDITLTQFVQAYEVETVSGVLGVPTNLGYFTDVTLSSAYVPSGAITVCDETEDGEVTNIKKLVAVCRCDDVALVSFVHVYEVESKAGVLEVTIDHGLFTDESMSSAYVLVGAEVECSSIGTDVTGSEALATVLAGIGAWSKDAVSHQVSIQVVTVGNALSLPQITTSSGTTGMIAGSYNFEAYGESSVLIGDLSVVSGAGDEIIITQVRLTTN